MFKRYSHLFSTTFEVTIISIFFRIVQSTKDILCSLVVSNIKMFLTDLTNLT